MGLEDDLASKLEEYSEQISIMRCEMIEQKGMCKRSHTGDWESVRILNAANQYEIEAVGFPREWSADIKGLQSPINYLQEIRSILIAMEKLFCSRAK